MWPPTNTFDHITIHRLTIIAFPIAVVTCQSPGQARKAPRQCIDF